MADWPDSVLERLAVNHHVIAVDLYGMGFSERNGDFTYGFALWSQQLVSVLDALGIERASVVGHSLGGTVAIFLRRTILTESIAWCSPALRSPFRGGFRFS